MNKEVYHPRYGRGTLLQTRGDRWTVHFDDIDATKTILKRFLRPPPRKDQRGDLEAHLQRAPRDDSSWLVYADLLQQEGDIRGELIVLEFELQGEARPELKEKLESLYRTHKEQWLGPLEKEPMELSWQYGFVESARIQRSPLRLLDALLKRSAGRFVTGLELRRVESSEMLIELLERVDALNQRRLDWLELQLDSLGDSGAKALADSSVLPKLRALHIEWNTMSAKGKQLLLSADGLRPELKVHVQGKRGRSGGTVL